MKKFGYKNKMAVPRIEKVVINTGFGKQAVQAGSDEHRKLSAFIAGEITILAGQKAVLTKSKKAISAFKLRQGLDIGAKVTLRGKRMCDFLGRFINLALPRTRDFMGIDQTSFDRMGNLNMAVREHIVFPEILPERAKSIFGLEITITTTAKSKEEGLELIKLLGFPMKK